MKLITLIMLLSFSAFSFEPIYKEAKSYKNKVSKFFSTVNNPSFCRIETEFIKDKNAIKIRAGVVGSPVDYFGWNALIDMKDFPLKKGFSKVYKTVGSTAMVLTYDGDVLKFKMKRGEKVWNRLYPFSIVIDPKLSKPVKFNGTMEGFERGPFGLKKHVVQSCQF